MSHFRDEFDPADGMVYGMGKWIHIYLYNYYYGWPGTDPREPKNDEPLSDFKISKDEWQKATDKYGTNVINNYNVPIKSAMFRVGPSDGSSQLTGRNGEVSKPKEFDASDALTDDPAYTEYFQNLLASREYGPESLLRPITALRSALSKYELCDPLVADEGANIKSRDKGRLVSVVADIAIRRSCKFGIAYFVESAGQQLHYLLDEMDMRTVIGDQLGVDKVERKIARVYNETMHKHKVPICTSELRYMFRNWNRLRGTGRINFYRNFETVGAPWEDAFWSAYHPGWAVYAAHRLDKYEHLVRRSQRDAFDAAWALFKNQQSPSNARAVVQAFHAIPSSHVNTEDD